MAARERNSQDSFLCRLPLDAQASILFQLTLAHDIALAGLTCWSLCDAAKLALKARPFSGEVVKLAGHTNTVSCVAAAFDGRVITGSWDKTVKVWREGACEHSIQAHTLVISQIGVAVLPGVARVSVSDDRTAKLWTLDGALERDFVISSEPSAVRKRRGAARRLALCARPWRRQNPARSGCTTSTERSSTPSRATPGT